MRLRKISVSAGYRVIFSGSTIDICKTSQTTYQALLMKISASIKKIIEILQTPSESEDGDLLDNRVDGIFNTIADFFFEKDHEDAKKYLHALFSQKTTANEKTLSFEKLRQISCPAHTDKFIYENSTTSQDIVNFRINLADPPIEIKLQKNQAFLNKQEIHFNNQELLYQLQATACDALDDQDTEENEDGLRLLGLGKIRIDGKVLNKHYIQDFEDLTRSMDYSWKEITSLEKLCKPSTWKIIKEYGLDDSLIKMASHPSIDIYINRSNNGDINVEMTVIDDEINKINDINEFIDIANEKEFYFQKDDSINSSKNTIHAHAVDIKINFTLNRQGEVTNTTVSGEIIQYTGPIIDDLKIRIPEKHSITNDNDLFNIWYAAIPVSPPYTQQNSNWNKISVNKNIFKNTRNKKIFISNIEIAAKNGDVDLLSNLLKKDQYPPIAGKFILKNRKNKALKLAIENFQIETVILLMNKGAKITEEPDAEKTLINVARKGHLAFLEFLIGKEIPISTKVLSVAARAILGANANMNDLLTLTCKNYYWNLTRHLLTYDLNGRAIDDDGMSAEIYAKNIGNLEIFQAILKY